MALEYQLELNATSLNNISNILVNKLNIDSSTIKIEKNVRNNDVININLFDINGLYIYILENNNTLTKYNTIEIIFNISIVFRYQNNFNNTKLQKQSMLMFVLKLIESINGDALFKFNGENMLLLKEKNNKIKINKYFGFWNEVEDILKGIEYDVINEKYEIDYYPIKEEKDSQKKILLQDNPIIHKTHLGKDYTKEEWEKFEEEEYRKYVEKSSGKKSSFLADEKIEKQNFSAESATLKEVKYFVMNIRQDKVPVYEFPSAMVAPFTFLENGTAIDIIKYKKNGWCEILSKEKKKAYIQSTYVKKND